MSAEQGKPVVLVILDLSAAFDMVDCNIIFSLLKDIFVLSSKVFEWFQSYLVYKVSRVCLFVVFSLTFRHCYLACHKIKFWILWFSHSTRIILESLHRQMGASVV